MSSELSREQILQALETAIRENQNSVDEFDQAVCDRLGINRTDGRCMDILERSGQMTAGELARASGLTTGAVTTLLDRLERVGYISRVRDTADRRRVLVELTAEARQRVWEFYGGLAEDWAVLSKRYTTEELALMLDFLRTGTGALQRQLSELRAEGQGRGEQGTATPPRTTAGG